MMATADSASRTDPNDEPAAPARDPARQRAANVRTALVFFSIALTFFFGVMVSKYLGGYEVGMSVVGFAVFVFLVFAIGRCLRKGR
jgi:hypothetical protein